MLSRAFRVPLLSIFACFGSACVVLQPTGAPQNQGAAPTATTSPCEITIVDNSFGGYCGDIEVVNNGLYPMEGWQVEFDLPSGSSLISSWNGSFQTSENHVTVTSLEPNSAMPPQGKIDLGYCASGAAVNVQVLPGSCLVQDGNTTETVASTSLNSAIDTNFLSLSPNNWSVVMPDVGWPTTCGPTPNEVSFGVPGLVLGGCGGIEHNSPVLFGAMSATIKASPTPGAVTQLMTGIKLPTGLQGLSLAIPGSNPNVLIVTVWLNDTPEVKSVNLGFDASAAAHNYGMVWQQSGVSWSVDTNQVASSSTLPQSVPEYLTISVWEAQGTPTWAGTFDPNTPVAPANITHLVFAPVVAIE